MSSPSAEVSLFFSFPVLFKLKKFATEEVAFKFVAFNYEDLTTP